MKLFHAIFIACFALFFIACPSDDKNDPRDYDPTSVKLPDTKLPARDGIPSENTMDRLLYFSSTQEDGPGLYAYRPSQPDDGAIYIDPDLDLVRIPFIHMIPLGVMSADGNISNYRAGGVMYAITVSEEIAEGLVQDLHQYTYVSSDPGTEGERYQVSKTRSIPGLGLNGLFSYDLRALTGSSFLQTGSSEPVRYDLSMGPDDEALPAPKGKVLMSTLADDLHTHTQWLYIEENGDLVFYNRDFTDKVPVIDVDTSQQITKADRNSSFVSHISYNTVLVGIALENEDDSSDSFPSAAAYRIEPPDSENPNGRAKRIENADGEPLIFKASLFGGLATPTDNMLFVRDDTILFASGDGLGSLFGSAPSEDGEITPSGITLTRIAGDEWSRIVIRDSDLDGLIIGGIDMGAMGTLPPMLIPVDGYGAFWAPNGLPELIEADSSNPDQWKRTSLAEKLPEPEDTPVTESVNGWIYYNHDEGFRGGAIAYHVPSEKLIHLRGARWVGVSGNGKGVGAGAASRVQMSEIFLLSDDNILGAVEASAPDKGIVALGKLPASVEEVGIQGPGMGPHRLIGLKHEGNRFEVVAVDTTKKDSLKALMDKPAEDWEKEIGEIFGEPMTQTVQAGYTRPVTFY